MADGSKRVLAGRYEIDNAVGQGGMAKVFRGTDSVLGRTVAVKVLAPEFARDSQFVKRFRREAQASAALNHPNIVSVFDTGSENGIHYIVMEYLEGRTLKEVISAEGRLHPDRATEIAESICRALGTAHQQGLVHRDVKPGNIMLLPSGEVKVMDFGIARATTGEALTQTAAVLGTASYFSPEQAKGEAVDARSDVYSVGCVLYEMLTGRAPFVGSSAVVVASMHVREEAPVPSGLNPDIPRALDAVVMKALAKNPANRYQSAAEMVQDLQRVREGLPVAATPILPGEPTQMVTRPVSEGTQVMPPLAEEEEEPEGRRTWLIVAITMLVLALLGIAAFFLIRELTSGPPTVVVPNVLNRKADDATRRLKAEGFRVEVTEQASETDKGLVFKTEPKPGARVQEGSLVTIFVSTGPKPVEVPDLFGKSVDEARTELEAVGLRLGAIERVVTDDFEAGTIFEQNPPADEKIKPGKAVDVVVAKEDTSRIVPNVVCKDLDTAKDLIEAQNLEMKVVDKEFSLSCAEGTVARQNPQAGEQVEAGSRVRVWESDGPPPESPDDEESP
ncbi:MAG TPA: Stk1 family PASTA domain-containing Ser/Thr kinase [Actinomycetota bacterium]|jgi:serine/threonine-protein kinase|nr:Stk1 family PASTA domain-containing Ser/Thr kinase [Actinomycetota bacterium]